MAFSIFVGILTTIAAIGMYGLMMLILIKDGPHELLNLLSVRLKALGLS